MTYYCYQDNEVRLQRAPVKYELMKATEHWLTHFGNSLYLTFLVKNEEGFVERQRATKELAIADRKMEYWKRHLNWDRSRAEAGADVLRKQWQGKRYAAK